MEHELGDPDLVPFGGDSAPGEDGTPDVADLPGGLYDDAVVSEDAPGLDEDFAVAELEAEFGLGDRAGVAELDIDGTLLDTIEQELADVERALALLDDGTYGRCEHCNGVIDDDVLARTPTARFCAEHLPLALR